MTNVLIVIKLNDNVVIPQNAANVLILGDTADFFAAQSLIFGKLPLQPDQTGFDTFYNAYKTLVPGQPLTALYYLADKVPYAGEAATVGNFLTYFAFAFPLDGLPLDVSLKAVISLPMVEFWWAEKSMTLCGPPALDAGAAPVNTYYDSLQFQGFGTSRGLGVTIVDAEDYGANPVHRYLSGLRRRVMRGAVGDPAHFYKTLGVLFAVPPAPTDKPVIGLVPSATLAVLAFNNAVRGATSDEFFVHFFIRHRIPKLTKDTALCRQRPVLLFERQVEVPTDSEGRFFAQFPLEVLPDMRRAMIACRRKGVLVVQPAGQQVGIGLNLDVALTGLNTVFKRRYTDFTKPVTFNDQSGSGSVCLTVGATATDDSIKPGTNTGSLVDVYLWGEGIETLAPGAAFALYAYTSGASAIAAGIVAALQAAALHNGKSLTTTDIKAIFRQTFRKGGSEVFSPTTLAQLWTVCMTQKRLTSATLP